MNIKERVLKEAYHILDTQDTIRQTAEKFKLSKSTVHKDIQTRLKSINQDLQEEINKIFKLHNEYRHIKGGETTKKIYKRE